MDGETKYVYLNAQHSYDMLPSTEHLSVGKLTLCNNGTQTLLGRGGNHIGDYFLYEIDLTGSLLEPEVKTYEDLRIVDLLPDGIRYDLNNNGETNDKIAYAFSDATIIAAQSMYAEKFIAPAGSDSWSKQGLLVKTGSDFDYLLEIVNETAAVHTGLTVYDTLPRIGDPNLFGASGRGSEFPVRLRGAITPPEGYTVYYTTSPEVYTHSMEEMVDSDIWTTSVTDYASVTAFKLVAGEGTELAGNSRFQVRIPVCAPKTFDEDSMDLLHAKTDQDQASGTASWLEAVNAFGFRTVQTPTVKESNTVWARVCFAGFCVKKVNGATQAALPGAFLLLSAAARSAEAASPSNPQRRRRKSAGGVFRQNAGFVCIFLQSSPAYVTLFTGKTYRRHGMDRYRIIEVKQSVFADNDAAAERLRGELDAQGTYLINLMSSPGSGKTTTLLRLLPLLQRQLRVGVMEADIDSDVDADTVSRTGAKVIQLHTDGMCHLDAGMTREGLQQLDAAGLDLVILENVGNLVCPAEFDTGAHLNLMILSVPEGHDKPLKYPLIFQTCGAMIVNKIDVLPYFDFDLDKVTAFARRRNPDLEIFPISAKTGEGVEALADWLCTRIRTHKEKKKETNA